MTSPALRVVLDANVLFPPTLRDTILRAAEAGLLRVHWSEEIIDELRRGLLASGRIDAEALDRLLGQMARAFPDACVYGYEGHVPFLRNDPKDRHVAAAAVQCNAAIIVTFNLKDFTQLPAGMSAIAPAELLLRLLQSHRVEMVSLLERQASEATRPKSSLAELLTVLDGMVKPFTDAVREHLSA